MGLGGLAGLILGVLGLISALLGIFLIDGISIEFPGILFGALGYYFSLQAGNRGGQLLGIAAAVLCVISMLLSGLINPPQ